MPSFFKARAYRKFLHETAMRYWNELKEKKDAAPDCFAKQVMDSDFESRGLSEEAAAWMVIGAFSFTCSSCIKYYHHH